MSFERAPLAPGVFSQLCCPDSRNSRFHLHFCSLRAQSLVPQLLLPLLRVAGPRTTAHMSWTPRLPLPGPGPAWALISPCAVIPDHLNLQERGLGEQGLGGLGSAEVCVLSPWKPLRKPWAGLRKGRGHSPARLSRRSPLGTGIRGFRSAPGFGSTCALGLVETGGPRQAARRR